MGIAYRYGRGGPTSPGPANSTSPQSSQVTLNLTKCVMAAKEYLDLFIAVPTDEYSKLPLATWYQAILSTMVLYRLCIGLSNIPDWDGRIAQESVNLEQYLDELNSRLQLVDGKPAAETQCSPANYLFTMFPEILDSVKTSYISAKQCSNHNNDGSDPHRSLGGHPTKGMPSSTRGPYRCPGMRNLRRDFLTESMEQSERRGYIAAELEKIENEKLWSDVLVADALANLSNSSSTAHWDHTRQSHSGKTCVDTLFPDESYRCGNTVNNPSASLGS